MKYERLTKRIINYKNYGGRGITVCDEWRDDVQAFYDWAMKSGYKEELLPNGRSKWTLDRIDVNGNYEPSNCRWATVIEQANNRRKNHFITYNGETLTIAQIAIKYGIKSSVLSWRIRDGWDIKRAIETPIKKRSKIK